MTTQAQEHTKLTYIDSAMDVNGVDKPCFDICKHIDSSTIQYVCELIDEDDARRLVACWNACVGVPTEVLDDVNSSERELLHHYVETLSHNTLLREKNKELQTHRTQLLEALKQIRDTPHSMVNDSESLRHTLRLIDHTARAAIRDVEGEK